MRYDPDTLYVEIGRRISDERKRRSITQAQLADMISLTRTSITNIEKGNQKILLHSLYAIAHALGATPQQLMPKIDREEPSELEAKLPEGLDEHEQKWIRSIVAPSGEEQP